MRRSPYVVLFYSTDKKIKLNHLKFLEGTGHLVKTTPDLNLAAEMIEKQIPDFCIFDLDLQKREVLNKILELEKTGPISLISSFLLTSFKDLKTLSIDIQAMGMDIEKYKILPRNTGPRLLLRELKRVLLETEKVSVPVPKELSSATLHIRGAIQSSNEAGFLLEAPVKIARNTKIHIKAPLIERFELEECIFKRSNYPATRVIGSEYYNDISIVGVGPKSAQKIKREKIFKP